MDGLPSYRTRLTRAKELAAEFDLGAQDFFASKPYSVEKAVEAGTGDTVYTARVHRDIPAMLGMRIGEAAHQLRTGLDLMVAAMIRKTGERKSKNSAFVISDSREKFLAELPRGTKGLPDAARNLIAAFKPYKGGDDGIWAIAKLDNEGKHHDNLLAYGECKTVDIGGPMFAMMEKLVAKDGPDALAGFREMGLPSIPLIAADPPLMRDGEVLLRICKAAGDQDDDSHDLATYGVEILFAKDIIEDRRPASIVIRELITRVDAIMRNFENAGYT